nr:hypothetical protein [Tanacetum cinerariifolium]
MSLTFADTHNVVSYLNKSDASEGFNQVGDFLNGRYIKYALTINPCIYVSCIKQFWNIVVVKQTNDVTRLQALVDKKKVMITDGTIRDALRLDDAEGVDCLPNEEISAELARMGYEKPSTKITFYKAFFSSQRKMVRKGCSGVETPLFKWMLIAREPERIESSDDIDMEDATNQGRMIAKLDRDEGIALMDDEGEEKKAEDTQVVGDEQVKRRQAEIYQIDMDYASKVLSIQEDKPEVQEVVEVDTQTSTLPTDSSSATTINALNVVTPSSSKDTDSSSLLNDSATNPFSFFPLFIASIFLIRSKQSELKRSTEFFNLHNEMERIAKVREAVKEGWTVGHDVAYEMPWNTWMKMMIENYCLRREKKKLETELWNLVVKDKVERYTSGLPDSIQGSVMASKPKKLQEVIKLARSLMLRRFCVMPIGKLRTKGEGMTIQETTILNNNLTKTKCNEG